VDNWGEFSLRTRGTQADPRTWPIVAAGAKLSFCLINLGDCSANPGYCRDNNGQMLTKADIPNADFGDVTGCGRDQGIFTGHLDIYDQNLPGMTIDLPNVCNGQYWLVSTTDPNDNFLEADETNNSIAVPITLTQQLSRATPAFTYSQISGQFAFNGTGMPAGARFRWNFHDGSPIDSINNPTLHRFATGGPQRVTFTVISPCGVDSVTRVFTVLGTAAEEATPRYNLRVAPNPTAGATTLHYALPSAAQTVRVEAYNVLGARVSSVDLGAQAAGAQTTTLDLGANLPAGVYVVWLRTEKGAQAVRVLKN
jgi:FlgD Ig-like domain/Lysyl oxidase